MLTHIQQNLIIFLLLVVIMVMAVLIASYFIWKRWCGRDLKRALEARQNAQEVETRCCTGETSSQGSRVVVQRRNHSYSAQHPTVPVEDTYFAHRTPQPSAPFMSSFRTNSGETSMVSISTSAGQGIELEQNQGSHLPSYDSLMRQRE